MTEDEEFEFRHRLEQEHSLSAAMKDAGPQPTTLGQKAANVGMGAMEALYSPFQVAGEAIRGAGEGEPLQVATAADPRGFRAPSILQRLMPSLQTPQPPADPFQKAYQGLEGLVQPNIQQGAQVVTGQPDAAAQLGGLAMGVGIGDTIDPMKGFLNAKKMLFAPKVPASRAFDIATAEKYGLGPYLTRADKTGSKIASKIESGLSSTLTGGEPIQANNEEKLRLLDQARQNIAEKFGTQMPPSAVGQEARLGMQSEMGEASSRARSLYKQIPDVPIPPENLHKALNDVDFQNLDKGALKTINEIRARLGTEAPITEETISRPIGSSSRVTTEDVPGQVKNIPGEGNMFVPPGVKTTTSKLESAYRVAPKDAELPSTPTFQKLNDIRNMLSKEIQADTTFNPIVGNQVGEKAQALIPIKKALDADYKSYVQAARKGAEENPYGNMEAKQFDAAFTKANSFYGDLKSLKSNKLVRKLADPQLSPSDIPDVIFRSGNIEDINTARAVLGDKGFRVAKKQFFTDLLDSKNIGRELDKYSNEFLKGTFNSDELQALREADSLAKTSKTAETLAGNSSRTAGHLATLATGGGLVDAARRMFTNPALAAGEAAVTLGTPYAAAKAYLGTGSGIPVPSIVQSNMAKLLGSVGSTGGQGLNVVGQNPQANAVLSQILQRLRKRKDEK